MDTITTHLFREKENRSQFPLQLYFTLKVSFTGILLIFSPDTF